jgi:hypothetical protein
MGGDSLGCRISELYITGTYTVAATPLDGDATDGVEFGDAQLVGVGDSVEDGAEFGEDITTVWAASFDADGAVFGDVADFVEDDTPRAVSDGTEFGEATALGVGDALADGTDFGDVVAAQVDYVAAEVDGVDLGDAPAAQMDYNAAPTDGAEFGDVGSFEDPVREVADGVDFGEDITTVWATGFDADGVLLGDEATYPSVDTRSVSDGVEFGEDFTITVTQTGEPDGALFGESLLLQIGDSAADGAVFGDASAYPADTARAVSDGALFGDLGSSLVAFVDIVSDGAEFGDESLFEDVARLVTDGMTLGEALQILVANALADGVIFADSAAPSVGESAEDGAIFGETLAVGVGVYKIDGATFGDGVQVPGELTAAASDSAIFGDLAYPFRVLTPAPKHALGPDSYPRYLGPDSNPRYLG